MTGLCFAQIDCPALLVSILSFIKRFNFVEFTKPFQWHFREMRKCNDKGSLEGIGLKILAYVDEIQFA